MATRTTSLGDLVYTRFEVGTGDNGDELIEHVVISTPKYLDGANKLRIQALNDMGKTWPTSRSSQ